MIYRWFKRDHANALFPTSMQAALRARRNYETRMGEIMAEVKHQIESAVARGENHCIYNHEINNPVLLSEMRLRLRKLGYIVTQEFAGEENIAWPPGTEP